LVHDTEGGVQVNEMKFRLTHAPMPTSGVNVPYQG